jgi:hypothetical protein
LLLSLIRFVKGQSVDVKRFNVGMRSPLSTFGSKDGVNGMSFTVISSVSGLILVGSSFAMYEIFF